MRRRSRRRSVVMVNDKLGGEEIMATEQVVDGTRTTTAGDGGTEGSSRTERIETVIVGGGQAGLAVGYHLAKRGRPFVILDAGERVGESWRQRWDSMRLF